MTRLKRAMNYNYTRIHAPFARDYSLAQGPNATSYFNAFSTYDFLLSIGVRPWIELGCVQTRNSRQLKAGMPLELNSITYPGIPGCKCMESPPPPLPGAKDQ